MVFSEAKKKSLSKRLAIVLDQKNLIEESVFRLLIDLKHFSTKKDPTQDFSILRERFKKIEDRAEVFEQNLQKISSYMGSAR